MFPACSRKGEHLYFIFFRFKQRLRAGEGLTKTLLARVRLNTLRLIAFGASDLPQGFENP